MLSLGNTQDQLDNHYTQFIMFQGQQQLSISLSFSAGFMNTPSITYKEDMLVACVCKRTYYVHI